jgi:hypothetical protein
MRVDNHAPGACGRYAGQIELEDLGGGLVGEIEFDVEVVVRDLVVTALAVVMLVREVDAVREVHGHRRLLTVEAVMEVRVALPREKHGEARDPDPSCRDHGRRIQAALQTDNIKACF